MRRNDSDAIAAASLTLLVKEMVRIDAEPGKTYFIRWSYAMTDDKMEVVDEATGANEVRKLHLNSDR
jgi:hypothetical protein